MTSGHVKICAVVEEYIAKDLRRFRDLSSQLRPCGGFFCRFHLVSLARLMVNNREDTLTAESSHCTNGRDFGNWKEDRALMEQMSQELIHRFPSGLS
jgi:hypothetical protein